MKQGRGALGNRPPGASAIPREPRKGGARGGRASFGSVAALRRAAGRPIRGRRQGIAVIVRKAAKMTKCIPPCSTVVRPVASVSVAM